MSLTNLVEETFVRNMVERGFSYQSISERLRVLFPESRGLSARSVRRFCKDRNINVTSLRWISDEHLEEMVTTNILQYGNTYGRRMMQGTLRYQMRENLHYCEISQRRISKMLKKVAPHAHRERAYDLLDRTNPVPYHAPYFGYKLHMDQNEKLAQEYGVTHVHALDGCSRMVLGFITIPKKNPVLIYQYLFRPLLLKYGLFDQLRVDHGAEFCLCVFVQELLKNRRGDSSRAPWRQTASTKNYRAERLWPEENARVNYPIKRVLNFIKEQEIFDMEDPLVSFAVSWVTLHVSKVGSENFVNSWNYHRIPGPNGCIPFEKMMETNMAVQLEPHEIPTTAEVVQMYEERGGRLNRDPSIGCDPIACCDHLMESREYLFLSQNPSFENIFSDVVHNKNEALVNAIKSFIDITNLLTIQVIP